MEMLQRSAMTGAGDQSTGCANPGRRAIDTHAHVFSNALRIAQKHRYVPNYDARTDHYMSLLQSHGLTNGVLVQPSFLGTDNSFMISALRSHPGVLHGVAVIDPVDDLPRLDSMDEAGCVGIRLNVVGIPGPDLNSRSWAIALSKLRTLGWLIEIQAEASRLSCMVDPLIDTGIDVVIDHFGRPDLQLGIADPGFRYLLSLADSPNIWVKISGAYRNGANGTGEKTALEAIPLLKSSFGLRRLVWGSDWPHTQFEERVTYDTVLSFLFEMLPDEGERRIVLSESASKLFRFRY